MNYQQPELQQRLAAEYVLGTLHGSARRRFERLLVNDRALLQSVRAWEQRLQPWAAAVASVAPPARLWRRIQIRLGHAAAEPVVSANPWRWFSFASSALAAMLVAVLVVRPHALFPPPPTAPAYRDLAVLSSDAAEPVWIVRASADNSALQFSGLSPVQVPSDRDLELWSIPQGGSPLSLGVMRLLPDGTATLTLTELGRQRAAQGAVLAISLEPSGGSRTGSPTGPVLYTGKFRT